MERPAGMTSKSHNVDISRGLHIKYTGAGETDRDAASARSDVPIPTGELVFYFEVRVVDKGRDGYIGIGLCGPQVASNRLPGWERHSYGYHGDDGNTFACGQATRYGPTFGTGDVVGCCVNMLEWSCFFTRNGKMLPVAFRSLEKEEAGTPLHACVGLRSPGEEVEVNLGGSPFVFDIQSYIMEVRAGIQASIDAVDVSTHTWVAARNSLVLAYLTHHSCPETAMLLASATATPMPEPIEAIRARSAIRSMILAGDVEGAHALLLSRYPGLLDTRPGLRMQMLSQQFIELVGQHAGALPDSHLASILACGRELHALGPGGSDTQDIFGLLAYENPRLSPLAPLLDPSRRSPLADAINSAILDFQGRPRRTPLELAAAQLGACLNAMHGEHMACASGLNLDSFMGER